jgi:hypothetical protein
MEKHNKHAMMALKRAAAKVAKDARKNNYKLPVWRNGKIEYRVPEIATEPNASPDPWTRRGKRDVRCRGR